MMLLLWFAGLTVACYGGLKAVGKFNAWRDERADRKLTEGFLRQEIEEDLAKRRPTQEEIWAAEREVEEWMAD